MWYMRLRDPYIPGNFYLEDPCITTSNATLQRDFYSVETFLYGLGFWHGC